MTALAYAPSRLNRTFAAGSLKNYKAVVTTVRTRTGADTTNLVEGEVGGALEQVDAPPSKTERETTARDHIVARLRTFTRYGAGWDGEGADTPRQTAIRDAINLVANTASDVVFQPALEPDGSVELICSNSQGRAILVLEGDGKVWVHLRTGPAAPPPEEFSIPRFLGEGRSLEAMLSRFQL